MKKIPLKPAPEMQTTPLPPAPTAVPEALDVLLLGGIWWFTLLLLPLLQQEPSPFSVAAVALLVKVQGMASVAIALVLLGVRLMAMPSAWRSDARSLVLLAAIAVLGGVLVWQSLRITTDLVPYHYSMALQAILALGYFMARRRYTETD